MSGAAAAGATGAETRKRVRDYLACDDHSNRAAERVCGECGSPLCDECASRLSDITLEHYERGGGKQLVIGLGLVIGVPLLLEVLAPNLVGSITGLLFDEAVYLEGSLVRGSIVVGLAYLAVVRYRTRYGLSDVEPLEFGSAIGDFELLTRRSGTRTVCEQCKPDKQVQTYLLYGITLVAGALVVYGLYQSLPNLFFVPLRYSAVGIALYLARDELVALVVGLGSGAGDRDAA